MKKFRIFLMLIMAVSLQISALAQNKETREVRDFDEIQMRVGGKVFVTQGDKNEVILEGDEDYLDDIETDVRSGRLIIKDRRERSWKFWGNSRGRLTVYVTVKELTGAFVSGSGDIIGQSKFKADDFTASISGSGDIELEVEADYVSSRISGSGNIELAGKSNKAKLSISGSGKYFAEKMVVGDYNISMSGSGRGSVNVEGELDVRISGSGKIYYMGKPTSVNSSVAGSGTVRKIN
jgi:Putative auto-transporter adhesin, head GIN domain